MECRGVEPRAGDLGGLNGNLRTPLALLRHSGPLHSSALARWTVSGLFHLGRVPVAMACPSAASSPDRSILHMKIEQRHLADLGPKKAAMGPPLPRSASSISSRHVSKLSTPAYNASKKDASEVDAVTETMNETQAQDAKGGGATPPAATIRRDVWDLDEGRVVLERPADLSVESLEYLEAWLSLLLKKIKKESVKDGGGEK